MGCLRRSRTLPFVRRFTIKELEAATNGFTTALEATTTGGGGACYRARFAGGLVATVRRANAGGEDRRHQGQGTKGDFHLEVQLLGRLNHRHLVGLRGFAEGHHHHNRFLVFDHTEHRSLKECLHDPLRTPLDWRTRLQVAVDIAAALEYLYYFCDPPVFQVSVNSSSVVLDANLVAKLSDVRVISHDAMKRAKTSEESFQEVARRRRDLVFQYGVLVLELVTGQSPGRDGELVRWVQGPGFAGTMHRMADADLCGAYDAGELRDLVVVARLCTSENEENAVSLPQVLRYLQGKVERLGGGRCPA